MARGKRYDNGMGQDGMVMSLAVMALVIMMTDVQREGKRLCICILRPSEVPQGGDIEEERVCCVICARLCLWC